MTAEHVTSVAELEKICFGTEAWSEKSVTSELTNALSLWLVADDNGRVAGYVGSQTVMDETDMMNVAVHPDYRKQGIATALIVGLVGELRKKGSHCLTLEVRASNENAISLYRKLDFQQIGLRKNYYHNPKEDALILRKEF
jgi:ribosomal-protein-alanine N-acetyltransferase